METPKQLDSYTLAIIRRDGEGLVHEQPLKTGQPKLLSSKTRLILAAAEDPSEGSTILFKLAVRQLQPNPCDQLAAARMVNEGAPGREH